MFFGLFWGDWTILLLIPAMIFALWAQFKVQSTFKKYDRVMSTKNLTGADAAGVAFFTGAGAALGAGAGSSAAVLPQPANRETHIITARRSATILFIVFPPCFLQTIRLFLFRF